MQTAIAAAFNEFRAVDKLLSIHRPDSDLARANAGGTLSPELAAVIQRALAIAQETDGASDPTIRPLADLWSSEERRAGPECRSRVSPRP